MTQIESQNRLKKNYGH